MRGAPACRQPRRHRDRLGPLRSPRLYLPRRRPAQGDHRHRPGPQREPARCHPEPRRPGRGERYPDCLCRQSSEVLYRPAPALLRTRRRFRRDQATRPPGRLLGHAGQGKPRHSRSGHPGSHAGERQPRADPTGLRRRLVGAQPLSAHRGQRPAGEHPAVGPRLQPVADPLHRRHHRRRGPLCRHRGRFHRLRHRVSGTLGLRRRRGAGSRGPTGQHLGARPSHRAPATNPG